MKYIYFLYYIYEYLLFSFQMLMIMADLKMNNNWVEALKHIPKRKLLLDFDSYQRGPIGNNHKLSAKRIRDDFRRNSVYNLLIKK